MMTITQYVTKIVVIFKPKFKLNRINDKYLRNTGRTFHE